MYMKRTGGVTGLDGGIGPMAAFLPNPGDCGIPRRRGDRTGIEASGLPPGR